MGADSYEYRSKFPQKTPAEPALIDIKRVAGP
jgi:hypothetical protein